MTYVTSTCSPGTAQSAGVQRPPGVLFDTLSTSGTSSIIALGVNNAILVSAFGLGASSLTFERLRLKHDIPLPGMGACVYVPEATTTVLDACAIPQSIVGCSPEAVTIVGPGYFRATISPAAIGIATVSFVDLPVAPGISRQSAGTAATSTSTAFVGTYIAPDGAVMGVKADGSVVVLVPAPTAYCPSLQYELGEGYIFHPADVRDPAATIELQDDLNVTYGYAFPTAGPGHTIPMEYGLPDNVGGVIFGYAANKSTCAPACPC